MMATDESRKLEVLLDWCESELGPVERVSDHGKSHPGDPVLTCRIRIGEECGYLKTHRNRGNWEVEIHAYEQWTSAFGGFAPRLLAVREDEPLALVISSLNGKCLGDVKLSPGQEQTVWRDAGKAIVKLHNSAKGDFFGPCNRDGSPKGENAPGDAVEFMSAQLRQTSDRGNRKGYLSADELKVVQAAMEMVSAYEGEFPVPCHRDYCPANWIVTEEGKWAGVIDFEFSEWNVRATDYTRYPDWDWTERPDLAEAFFEGYGKLSVAQEQQRLVAHVRYALQAIVWGEDNNYRGFAEDGRKALRHLESLF